MNPKILTIAVPCYNSAPFMNMCLDSLIPGGNELEILVIDDGSPSDNTWEIAMQYQERYPDIVRAIHQENGGFGEAINTAMREASGEYFGIMDADDSANTGALLRIIKKMTELLNAGTPADLFLCNYVYRKEGSEDVVMHLRGAFEPDRILSWDDLGRFSISQYMMIHNIFYKKEILDKTHLFLPSHVCYSDNLIKLCPLRHCHRIYYMDVDYYYYTIGRPGQSVNEAVQIRQLDQQLFITRLVIDGLSTYDFKKLPKKLHRLIVRDLALLMATTSMFLYIRNDPGDLSEKKAIWRYAKEKLPEIYPLLRRQSLSIFVHFPTPLGRMISVKGYRYANRKLNFR